VNSFQIDPRRRYHSISLSLLAYSARSRAAAAGAFRRRLRETISMTSAVIRGRLEPSLVADKVAEMFVRYISGESMIAHTIYEGS
jgi:hypothetical protein